MNAISVKVKIEFCVLAGGLAVSCTAEL